MGYQAHFGHWLVTGRPQVILLDVRSASPKLIEFKYDFWEHHQISTPKDDHEINEVLAFWIDGVRIFPGADPSTAAAPRFRDCPFS